MQETQPQAERKSRKSVAFSEGTTIVDGDGRVTESEHGEDKVTAESHSTCESTSVRVLSGGSLLIPAATDKEVDEVTDMFAGMNKKKKKPKSKTADEEVAPDAEAAADFDATTMKKKKKKSSKTKTADASGDFEAKLAEAGVEEDVTEGATNGDAAAVEGGDLEKGTGIWAHSATAPIGYNLLLTRFFSLVNQYNPDILNSGSKSYKIPPPQCLREGNKKTIFANIAEICKRMKRSEEHVTQFLFAELGTSGSVDGNRRLVIKGRFQQKQIENVLRRYIGKSMFFQVLSMAG